MYLLFESCKYKPKYKFLEQMKIVILQLSLVHNHIEKTTKFFQWSIFVCF